VGQRWSIGGRWIVRRRRRVDCGWRFVRRRRVLRQCRRLVRRRLYDWGWRVLHNNASNPTPHIGNFPNPRVLGYFQCLILLGIHFPHYKPAASRQCPDPEERDRHEDQGQDRRLHARSCRASSSAAGEVFRFVVEGGHPPMHARPVFANLGFNRLGDTENGVAFGTLDLLACVNFTGQFEHGFAGRAGKA
jgi:hypothetical protein